MRQDICGIFWDDTPPFKIPKAPVEKRQAPERVWEKEDYLPYIEEAKRLPVSLFTDEELRQAKERGERLVFDCEVYPNYFLIAFASIESGKVIYFEMTEGNETNLNINKLGWIMTNFTVIGFNSLYFDLPVVSLALARFTCEQLKKFANNIIMYDIKPWLAMKQVKVKMLECDHIDLISVCPLAASLKLYGGRLHVPRLQELPFRHDLVLNTDQIDVVRWYCIGSDLTATAFVYMEVKKYVELREQMSGMYGTDLRSKSDAQIAEAVITRELTRFTYGQKPSRPEIPQGTTFYYKVPDFIEYKTFEFKEMLEVVRTSPFVIGPSGAPIMPKRIEGLELKFKGAVYRMGIGGLHSSETKTCHISDDTYQLYDRDVASYYPAIILNLKLFPKHLGKPFLDVYKTLVDRRLAAKKAKNKIEADALKIVVNGSFGKLGSKYSVLYSPDLLIQVTMTGQLSLLMLIEKLSLCDIIVCSANTDGILLKVRKDQREVMLSVIKEWETETGFITEEEQYKAFFSRDVNNYIGIKENENKAKVKGSYSEFGSALNSVLSKNPVNLICRDAVIEFLIHGTPIEKTIWECKDIRRFISIRTVKGGAVKDGEYLGKAIRWYQSSEVEGEIIYAKNGNKVPNSERCRPCLTLPQTLPNDLDYERYKQEALKILEEIAYPHIGENA